MLKWRIVLSALLGKDLFISVGQVTLRSDTIQSKNVMYVLSTREKSPAPNSYCITPLTILVLSVYTSVHTP